MSVTLRNLIKLPWTSPGLPRVIYSLKLLNIDSARVCRVYLSPVTCMGEVGVCTVVDAYFTPSYPLQFKRYASKPFVMRSTHPSRVVYLQAWNLWWHVVITIFAFCISCSSVHLSSAGCQAPSRSTGFLPKNLQLWIHLSCADRQRFQPWPRSLENAGNVRKLPQLDHWNFSSVTSVEKSPKDWG